LRDLSMRENLVYLILLLTMSKWRDFILGVGPNVMKFKSFGDSTSIRVNDKLKTIGLCIEGRFSRSKLQ